MALAGLSAIAIPLQAALGIALFTLCHFGLLQRSARPARLRGAVAFAFGLIHGCGFAGALGELALPADRLVMALFGFNLGVELGQLAIVALVWPLLRRWVRRARWVAEFSSAAIAGLGVFWFVTRSFG